MEEQEREQLATQALAELGESLDIKSFLGTVSYQVNNPVREYVCSVSKLQQEHGRKKRVRELTKPEKRCTANRY